MSTKFITVKAIADIFIENINSQYLRYCEKSNDIDHYIDFAQSQCYSSIQTRWCKGGTAGSCWDEDEGPTEVGEDPEPDFDELTTFLSTHFPSLHEDDLSTIINSYESSSEYDSDYYGGSIEYATKFMPFSILSDFLINFLYQNSDDIVDFHELVLEQSKIITTLDLEEYEKYKLYHQFIETIPTQEKENDPMKNRPKL